MDLPAAAQLAWKRERVAAALGRFGSLAGVEVRPCVPSPSPAGYRTRVKLAVAGSGAGGRVAIGLFLPGTHDVIDVPRCAVAHPALLPVIDDLRELLGRSDLPIVHVDLRWSAAERKAHVTLVSLAMPDRASARRLAEALTAARPEVAGVGLRTAGGGPVPRAVGGVTEALAGVPHLVESIGRARFRLSPGAFFQADPAAAARLHDVVRAWLADPAAGPAAHLADLYAGVGAFAIGLAGVAARATAVETVPAAADDAVASAVLSGVEVRVVRSPVEVFLRGSAGDPPDRVVVDPPRRGMPPAVLRALAIAAPARTAYVSCDPDTLARDLDVLASLGLAPAAVVPVDMFSMTDEVEAVALIEPARRPWKAVVRWRGEGALAAEKPAVLPTHPQARGEPSLLDAVRRAAGLDDLQAAHRLDVGTSGPVLFGRGESLRALGRAFESGGVGKEYLALVRGVPRKAGRVGGRRRPAGGDAGESTRYRLEGVVGGYGLVRVFPETGRRHQIRRHLASIGHPVLGDERYGDRRANRFLAETCALARPFLHLAVIEFDSPGGDRIRIESPLPPELALAIGRLRDLRA